MADAEAGKADFRKTLRTMGTQSVVVHIKEFGLNPVVDRKNKNVLRADRYNQIHLSEHTLRQGGGLTLWRNMQWIWKRLIRRKMNRKNGVQNEKDHVIDGVHVP